MPKAIWGCLVDWRNVNVYANKMSHKIIIFDPMNSEKSAFYLCHEEHTPMTSVTEASILPLDFVLIYAYSILKTNSNLTHWNCNTTNNFRFNP